ncbi:hypothetical protein BU26DRAFT_73669 [Trematosphaeria pertusa]|uniref:Uncharacterized protein n=1 Tax=Trematosphaeria pertusa TaxID=390896 RepID=A0A6A6I830_9PLEO|nr:uncharacterized protein BU26DRAFT_73669 [Trematosphaeria pertusa]KAF2245670.1 hypothetical protein BU26DRAFT_73669 [Trematosphaeria pertusa]
MRSLWRSNRPSTLRATALARAQKPSVPACLFKPPRPPRLLETSSPSARVSFPPPSHRVPPPSRCCSSNDTLKTPVFFHSLFPSPRHSLPARYGNAGNSCDSLFRCRHLSCSRFSCFLIFTVRPSFGASSII